MNLRSTLPKWALLVLVCSPVAYTQVSKLDVVSPLEVDQKALATEQEGLFYLWNVETKQTVDDNFGHYIAARYYVAELLLNNQLKQSIIVTGVGFNVKDDGNFIQIAATDPQTIKGILLKNNLVGRGARIKNVIAMTGLMLTGASGFFKTAGAAATYNRTINIFNDPFQKGLGLVSPNTIVTYLETINQDIFKTGLVLAPGSMGYLRVFVDKNNVFPPSKLKTLTKQQKDELYDPTEPLAVQRILNEIVLQGQRIEKATSQTFRLAAR